MAGEDDEDSEAFLGTFSNEFTWIRSGVRNRVFRMKQSMR
jgi:hypothetical protein